MLLAPKTCTHNIAIKFLQAEHEYKVRVLISHSDFPFVSYSSVQVVLIFVLRIPWIKA